MLIPHHNLQLLFPNPVWLWPVVVIFLHNLKKPMISNIWKGPNNNKSYTEQLPKSRTEKPHSQTKKTNQNSESNFLAYIKWKQKRELIFIRTESVAYLITNQVNQKP
jgi:hypothetical protein